MRIIFIVLVILLSAEVLAANSTPQEGYSTSTLKEPVFEYAKVVVESTAFNNWLNSNYTKISNENIKGYREHLYYLIDSYVKETYIRDNIVFPDDDLVLRTLFSWAERLGAYGGSLVYNSIKKDNRASMQTLMTVPSSFSLELERDLFKVSSKTGKWTVKVPYYFMIQIMNDFTATNGMETQLVSISTGAAKDKSQAGHSQATLMLIYSPNDDLASFSEYWGKQFAIATSIKKQDLGVKGLSSQKVYDENLYLHKELVFWSKPNGSYAAAYLGMDGTYQWNRVHFMDFLQTIEIGEGSLPNNKIQVTPKSGAPD